MYIERHEVTLTVNADGDLTTYTSGNITGRILEIRLIQPVSGGLDSGADITITGETTGTAILAITNQNATSTTYRPRGGIVPITATGAGTASTYDGTRPILEPINIANERIKVVVAAGGVSLTATLHILVG